jgi:FkbM family methyltransferase
MRSLARRAGVTRLLGNMLVRSGYEQRFDDALLKNVMPGDTVWDVGANIGYYSAKLADAVGEKGQLYAFEPSPANQTRLREKLSAYKNCTVVPFALGSKCTMLFMEQGSDDIGATSRIIEEAAPGRFSVEMVTGDEAISANHASVPDVIKIDVEGYELEVLDGMHMLLAARRLRTLGIEVHFGLLEARGMSAAPTAIVSKLEAVGFNVTWPDSSHIVAERCAT